jgi:exodeoxyribonuclease VII large subunit
VSRLESSPEAPLPLRRVSQAVAEWIGRLGEVWIEGQIAQFVRRPGVATHFITLRDTDANISMLVTASRTVTPDELTEGARIVLRVRPDFYAERGTLSLRATEIRQVGLGELLARLDRLRKVLAAEGLFSVERKRRLPFLPHTIGLITGRASAAEHDVVTNTRRRFPGARFAIENAATQGTNAVTEVIAALRKLAARDDVEVIVIARGGGSVEDLLPFSNEALIREVARCRKAVVSAIGHEEDQPLLDLVADYAASTPTDAAKHIVPDLGDELRWLTDARHRLRASIHRRLDTETQLMTGLPERLRRSIGVRIDAGDDELNRARYRIRTCLRSTLDLATSETSQLRARVVSLSPQAVLNRGYAVIWDGSGQLIRTAADAFPGQALRARVAHGEFTMTVVETEPAVGSGPKRGRPRTGLG